MQGRRPRRTDRIRRCFAQRQELYKRNPQKLADLVKMEDHTGLIPKDEMPTPPAEEILRKYAELWGTAGTSERQYRPGMARAITSSEVISRVKKLKAAGLVESVPNLCLIR